MEFKGIPTAALAAVTLYASVSGYGIKPAVATDLCVELPAARFALQVERRGSAAACAGAASAKVEATAIDRARTNASHAITSQCLRRVTFIMADQACHQAGSSSNGFVNGYRLSDLAASPKSVGHKASHIGQGTGDATGVALCTIARDLRLSTHTVVDGHCPHGKALLPNRVVVVARAQARCAVVCSTP
jgi:hypothetical protein